MAKNNQMVSGEFDRPRYFITVMDMKIQSLMIRTDFWSYLHGVWSIIRRNNGVDVAVETVCKVSSHAVCESDGDVASGDIGLYFLGCGVASGYPDQDFLFTCAGAGYYLRLETVPGVEWQRVQPVCFTGSRFSWANWKLKHCQAMAGGFPDCISACIETKPALTWLVNISQWETRTRPIPGTCPVAHRTD